MKSYNREIVKRILEEMPKEKKQVLSKALERNMILTSSRVLSGCELTIYKEGWLVSLHGTRCAFSVFAKDNDGEFKFMRKPNKNKLHRLYVEWANMSENDFYGI